MKEQVRVSKLMAERGICSRREADDYIQRGLVLVNGEEVSVLGTRASKDAVISLKKEALRDQNKKVTILLNKPIGFVSTQPEKGYPAAIELIIAENEWCKKMTPIQFRLKDLHVAGRLDIDSKGLLILTQDGALVKKIIGPHSDLEKEYIVGVEGSITKSVLQKLAFGLTLDGKPLKRASVEVIEPYLLRFILKEGRKRQIRRMCELVGLKVTRLKRVRVGKILLGNLPEGKWRYFASNEEIG